jgi:hypothetical protein
MRNSVKDNLRRQRFLRAVLANRYTVAAMPTAWALAEHADWRSVTQRIDLSLIAQVASIKPQTVRSHLLRLEYQGMILVSGRDGDVCDCALAEIRTTAARVKREKTLEEQEQAKARQKQLRVERTRAKGVRPRAEFLANSITAEARRLGIKADTLRQRRSRSRRKASLARGEASTEEPTPCT